MGFMGIIVDDRHKIMWSRAILSLSAVSEYIKFIISRDELSLSAVSGTRTSHGEIKFKQAFFLEYQVQLGDWVRNHINDDEHYLFVVVSRNLSTLMKNMDASDLEYIVLRLMWPGEVLEEKENRLLIETKTRSLIIKKYQTSIQPVKKNPMKISEQYRQQLEKGDSVKYLVLEQHIAKLFLDMVPPIMEDFSLEFKDERIQFTGYNRQVMKDADQLRQQMSVTISLALEEVAGNHIDTSYDKVINFRLKDFRNFVNLSTAYNTLQSKEEDAGNPTYLYELLASSRRFLEILFKVPGEPILFEAKPSRYVTILFVELTSDEGAPSEGKNHYVLPSHVVASKPTNKTTSHNRRRAYLLEKQNSFQQLFVPDESYHAESQLQLVSPPVSATEEMQDTHEGQPASAQQNDTDYSSDENSNASIDSIGPTQIPDRPKSIFDRF